MLAQFMIIYLIQSRQSQFKNDLKEFYNTKGFVGRNLKLWELRCDIYAPIFLVINPLNPKIKIWILICCPNSFPTEVVGRSW